MADLVLGLAKYVVEGVLTKAQAAIEEEDSLRRSAQSNLVFISGEFEMMHSFLKVATAERVENPVVRTWVRQIRELAYDVEDCIEFVVHLDKRTKFWLLLRRMVPSCGMAPPMPLDEASGEIEQLKARVHEVSTRNTRYNLISDTGSKPVVLQQQQPVTAGGAAAIGAATFDMLVEARAATKRQQQVFADLTRLIVKNSQNDAPLQVISVWGSGGDHGTTSIIRNTYNHPHFCQPNSTYNRAWVKLVHPFTPCDFVSSLMAQFFANRKQQNDVAIVGVHVRTEMEAIKSEAYLFNKFKKLVTQRKYLIVLEGLSNMLDWDTIRTFLPDMKNGSWIIVSTQQCETATLCIGRSYQILELKKFSDDHSICALLKGSQGDGDKGKNSSDTLFGRQSRMKELGSYLAKARINSPPVMSVWGIAGVGKSALVRKLYDETRLHTKNYDKYFWVDVSHPFNLRDLYLSLLQDIHSEKDPIEECHQLLREQRCLIVMDELRSTEEWDLMQSALVCKQSKSVIIVITTDKSIATYCTNNVELVFNVKALEAAAAFDIFKEVYKKLQDDVEVQELILKCGGIPKVIAAIAGVLASNSKTIGKRLDIVRSLKHRFMHHLETNPEYDSLQDLFDWIRTYFRDCPDYLKPCIFYLSIFPQGNIIRRRRLVRRWIAEGYSRDSHNESAEENGEKHFSELLELSIIQQLASQSSSTSLNVDTDVRMVFCQVNGFIREYIVSQRMEENLVFELGDKCALTTQRTGRHLVILKEWYRDRIVFESIDFSRLRSLTVFGDWKSFFISESMKLLRVLDLEDASRHVEYEDLERVVKWLRRLKFLSLRGHSEIHYLPSSFDRMRQLQTLDIRDTSIVTLPETITKLCNLQYIRAGSTDVEPAVSSSRRRCQLVGVEVPRGIGKLTALHTLGVINIGASGTKTMMKELKRLTQLRKLGVSGINRKNIREFEKSVHGAHLESLSVQLDKDNQGCLDDISMPWVNLRSLKLYGLQDKLPQWSKHLSKLRKLDLEMATLEKYDNTEFLAKLPELCILRLRVKQRQDGKLHFYAEMYGEELPTYEKVKILEISCSSSSLLHLTFGSETMKNLELLKLDCSSLSSYHLTGLNYLSELKEVLLVGTNDETLKTGLEKQLLNHPKKPAVKLERN